MTQSRTQIAVSAVFMAVTILTGCGQSEPPKPAANAGASAGDAAFAPLAASILEDVYARNPTLATDLGIHKFDDKIRDYSAEGIAAELQAARGFKAQLEKVDPATLSVDRQLDREQLIHAMDSLILQDDVIRGWEKDPDQYSGGLTNTAYTMIKREFAPAATRLKLLTTRLEAMPGVLAVARANLKNPPKVYTEIAIEQLDGNREFFKSAVVQAFAGVKDAALQAAFKKANDAVIAALGEYKTWLQTDLLKRSTGDFAYGADTYRKRLLADEMIDTPLDELLRIAEADLKRNQAEFAATAKKIAPGKSPLDVLAGLQSDHPPASKLMATTQAELDSLAKFLSDRHIITIPPGAPARVKETPPFMRATTSASMDTPGPFETVATEAYYNMTLPDPKWPAAEQNDFMKQWYYAAITNVSVHEVWPGHYLQFLYAKSFPSDVRKVFGAASNSEGWAHYAEQMVLDEGWHQDDLRYRLAQIQDALLRDVRFIVGIKLHTQGLTIPEAEQLFIKEGYQPAPVARSETKRGTSDATYGYYTMGKLMILKLRDDYRAKQGTSYTLQGFHDTFIKLGPLPLPLIRRAMLGESGKVF